MAKPDWGIKRTCQNCGARFYDMLREPIVCPLCQTAHDPDRQPRSRRTLATSRQEPASTAPVETNQPVDDAADAEAPDDVSTDEDESEAAKADDDGDVDEIETESEDLIEDTSDLGQDDDDIGEVIEHIDDDIDDKN